MSNLTFKIFEKDASKPAVMLKGNGPDSSWTKESVPIPPWHFKKYGDGFYCKVWAKIDGKSYRVQIFLNLYDDKPKPSDDKAEKGL